MTMFAPLLIRGRHTILVNYYVFHYSFTTEGERIIIEKKQQDIAAFLKHFLRYQKKGKSITLKELKKIEDESYDLP